MNDQKTISKVASLIKCSEILIPALGAGMSQDSSVLTFEELEKALKSENLSYVNLSNGKTLVEKPELFFKAWKRYYQGFAAAKPHQGYQVLRRISKDKSTMIYTSNIDGFSDRAGFPGDQIYHLHGKHARFQCQKKCSDQTWILDHSVIEEMTEFPQCPRCGETSLRPNVFMFEDSGYIEDRDESDNFQAWMKQTESQLKRGKRCVILEVGCGTRVPTVRIWTQTMLAKYSNLFLVRINPKHTRWTFTRTPPNHLKNRFIPIRMGALEFMQRLGKLL